MRIAGLVIEGNAGAGIAGRDHDLAEPLHVGGGLALRPVIAVIAQDDDGRRGGQHRHALVQVFLEPALAGDGAYTFAYCPGEMANVTTVGEQGDP